MDGLEYRNTIVDVFFNNINNFKPNGEEGHLTRVYEYDSLKIVHDLLNDTISFKMHIYAEYDIQTDIRWVQHNNYTSTKRFNSCIKVMECTSNQLSMVSASNDMQWINFTTQQKVSSTQSAMSYFDAEMEEVITSNLNMHYAKIPQTEEEHFQITTVQDLILDFEQCQRVQIIIDYFKSYGLFIKGNGNRLYIKFK